MRARAILLALLAVSPALAGCLSWDGLEGEDRFVQAPVAFLREEPYPDLVVEVDHVEGGAPSEEALAVLERALVNVTDKRSILVTEPSRIPDLPEQHNETQLLRAHADTLDMATNRTAAVLHLLYVNGNYEDTPEALGLAYSWNRISPVFVYPDEIDKLAAPDPVPGNLSTPNPAPEKVERSVLVHEAGHVLGLVNSTTPMVHDRADPEHPRHSANEESVMYWSADRRSAALEHLEDNEHLPYKFDARDLQDLRYLREGHNDPIDRRSSAQAGPR